MEIKAVLFDLDGTLIDSSQGIIRSVRYALSHFGMEEKDTDSLYSFIGPPLSDSFQRQYGFSREKALEAVEVYRERYNKTGIFECSLYPGVKACICALKEKGYRIGMASSKPELSCRRILAHFGILELFDEVVGATFDGKRDRKEDVLKEVFRRWEDLSSAQMILIGDTVFDAEGAQAVGMPCIAVTYGFGNILQMKETGVTGICKKIEELPEILQIVVSGGQEKVYD